jgi:hypothetical protein
MGLIRRDQGRDAGVDGTTSNQDRPDQAELDAIGDEIAELAGHLHAVTYRLLARLREFDRHDGWGRGFTSCAAWLSWRTGIGPGPAREKVRVARALGDLPLLSDAMRRGQLSYAKARALRGATDATTPRNAPTAQNTVGRADRFQVVLHVDADALRGDAASTSEVADSCDGVSAETSTISGHAVLAGGVRVSAETSRRIACDSSVVVMRHRADGSVADVGRRTRVVPVAIRRALDHRDRGCRFPGCGNRFCDAHHVVHWADGGATRADNLVLLCRAHHRALHEDGFRIMRADDGFDFFDPHGRRIPDAPAPPTLPRDPTDAVRRVHRDDGVVIDAATTMPAWTGERLDLDFAIRTLRRDGG